MALVDAATAARHLNASPEDQEFTEDIAIKIEQATAIVIRYIKRPNHGWTASTNPAADTEFAIVQAAILKVLGNLYKFRGDDTPVMDPLSPDVIALLSMVRDPSLA